MAAPDRVAGAPTAATAAPTRHRPLVGFVLAAATVAGLVVAVLAEPRGHQPLPEIARYATTSALDYWRTTEAVNAVVYGSRGFDTFGETFLLLAAVVAVTTVCRPREPRRGFIGEETAGRREQQSEDPAHGASGQAEEVARSAERGEEGRQHRPATPDGRPLDAPGPEGAEGMSVVVRGAVRVALPFLITAGVYLMAWGYSPGGGFPAGAVLLGGALLAYVGFGYRRVSPVLRPDVLEPVELAGAVVIVVVGALGLIIDGSFFANFLPLAPLETIRSGGILQVFSGAELVEVATGLSLAVFALIGVGREWTSGEPGAQG